MTNKVLALEVTFRDDKNESHQLYNGYIYRQGAHFIATASEEDIRLFLEARIGAGQYSRFEQDERGLNEMASSLGNGVNKFSIQNYRIIPYQA